MGYIYKKKTTGYRASRLQSGIIKRMPSVKRVGQIMDDEGRVHPFTESPPLSVGDQISFKLNSDGYAFQLKKP